jgi:hypothetical protein
VTIKIKYRPPMPSAAIPVCDLEQGQAGRIVSAHHRHDLVGDIVMGVRPGAEYRGERIRAVTISSMGGGSGAGSYWTDGIKAHVVPVTLEAEVLP